MPDIPTTSVPTRRVSLTEEELAILQNLVKEKQAAESTKLTVVLNDTSPTAFVTAAMNVGTLTRLFLKLS